MARDSRRLLIVACAVAEAASVLATTASASLTKGVPIVVAIEAGPSRPFVLTYRPRAGVRLTDRGRGVRVVVSNTMKARPEGRGWCRLAGSERLAGKRGTLILSWNGRRQRARTGCRGAVTGRWAIAGGTGLYAGRHGRGTFMSDGDNPAVVTYRGLVITAV